MKKNNWLLHVVGVLAVIAYSFAAYHYSGLHTAVESRVLEFGLGAAISTWYLFNYLLGWARLK